jgi:hypothetical protein
MIFINYERTDATDEFAAPLAIAPKIPIIEIKPIGSLAQKLMMGIPVDLLIRVGRGRAIPTVDVQFWTSWDFEFQHRILKEFAPLAVALLDYANIHPRVFTRPCTNCINHYTNITLTDCVSAGRYCAASTRIPGPAKGRDIMLMGVRDLCMASNSVEDFWRFVNALYGLCPDYSSEQFSLKSSCVARALKLANVSHSTIEQCMRESFQGTDYDKGENFKLELEDTQ